MRYLDFFGAFFVCNLGAFFPCCLKINLSIGQQDWKILRVTRIFLCGENGGNDVGPFSVS